VGKFEVDGRGSAVEVITRYISQSLRPATSLNFLIEFTLYRCRAASPYFRWRAWSALGALRIENPHNQEVSKYGNPELYFENSLRVVCGRLDSGSSGDPWVKVRVFEKTISNLPGGIGGAPMRGTDRCWSWRAATHLLSNHPGDVPERTTMITKKSFLLMTLSAAVALGSRVTAQVTTDIPAVGPGAKPVTVEHIKVGGTALEGNLEGDAVERDVFVFLPPSYAKERSRRFPVVYALHGYSIGAEQWTHEIHVPQTIAGAFAQGASEMIVVLPDAKTVHNGSMYSSSVTTGDFENFIAHDVVAYVDAHYRTIARRDSHGLVGHSMGGYGATRIGMKHADVFGSLYIMSPCCLSPRTGAPRNPDAEKQLESVKTPEDSAKLPFFARAMLASAAAWSRDPRNPPLYLDLPTKDGQPQPDVQAKWTANAPLAFIDQYILKSSQVSRHLDRRRRSGRFKGRHQQAARCS
jgi:enterochelin esterase-like enzyme